MNDQEKKHYAQLYEQLSQQCTAEEMAEAFVFPSDLSREEEAEAREELLKLRVELKQNIRLVRRVMNERKRSKFYVGRGKKRRRCHSIGEAY